MLIRLSMDTVEPPRHRDDGRSVDSVAADAELLARRLLSGLPDRLAHSLAAARQARRVASTVRAADADLLVAAALLHDIGYAAALVDTGFHSVDGACYLIRIGASTRLASLVAHHSEANLLAAAAGAADRLDEFANERSAVTDALIYSDMTAGPTGQPVDIRDRLTDIHIRHADENPDLFAARLARVPLLLAAAERVERRLDLRLGRRASLLSCRPV